MAKKFSTKNEFVAKAKAIHGDKYNYSDFVYVSSETKGLIKCNICGNVFLQEPHSHLKGCGCKKCASKRISFLNKSKDLICGVGINDSNEIVKYNNQISKSYSIWRGMLQRCYESNKDKNESYQDCSVCEEWKRYSVFKKWFDNPLNGYKDGYQLDKDILCVGNRVYSPDTCCFVPQDINKLFKKKKKNANNKQTGIWRTYNGKYSANLSHNGKHRHIGTFNTIEEAFAAYKREKEAYIKEVAQKYYDEGKITKRVYDALMKYEVEITD